jgi:Zn-dependent protease with chaperone function
MTKLTAIHHTTWEHPADRAAMTALRQVPGLDDVLKMFFGLTSEKSLRMFFLANSVRVSEKQFPRLNSLVQKACDTLDIEHIPETYVQQTPFLNAGAVGVKKPFIILNSSLIDTLDDDEALYVIGHELGHCMSGHVLYKTMLIVLTQLTFLFLRFPGIELVLQGIIFALREWDRKSELSADRAGMLTVQKPEAVYSALMKMTGGKNIGEMDLNEFLVQAKEYDEGGDAMDSLYKLLNLLSASHPFPVIRIPEIKTWTESGSYEAILSGEYVRRDSEEASKHDFAKDFESAQKQYREDVKKSNDPLAKISEELNKTAEKLTKQGTDFLSDLFKKKEDKE